MNVVWGNIFQIMEHIRPKTGNPLEISFCFSLFFSILCLTNFSKHSYHDTEEYQLSAQHERVLVSVFGSTKCQLMDQLCPKMGNPLTIFICFSLFLLILCLPNVSKNSCHDTGSDKFSAEHKGGLVSVSWEHIVPAHGEYTP